MKFKINKDGYDKLSDDLKKLYKADGDEYVLNVSGMPKLEDVSGLKEKMEALLNEKKELATKQKEAIATAVEAALKKAQKDGDVEAITKSWETKYNAQADKHKTELAEKDLTIIGLNGNVVEMTSGSEATKLAASIAINGSAGVLLPHVQKRLKTEMKDGKPVTVVLGTDGKPSAATIAELTEEFKNDKQYAPLIVGSKGAGSGHQQQQHNAPPGGNQNITAGQKLSNARAG